MNPGPKRTCQAWTRYAENFRKRLLNLQGKSNWPVEPEDKAFSSALLRILQSFLLTKHLALQSYLTARTSRMLSRARKNLSEEKSLNRFSICRLLKMRCKRKSGTGSKSRTSPCEMW